MKSLKSITFLAGLMLAFVISASAQNVNVAGSTGADGSYATLGAAFTAINANTNQTGNVINILITGDTNEGTATATLNQPSGGSWTSMTINPFGGFRTISGATTAGNPLIDFNGADNVTIDGQSGLAIANTTVSATSGTATIRFIGGATGNTITNSNIQGSGTASVATNGGIIFFSTDANTANGNDNNTISNNSIGPAGANLATKGILCNGSTTTTAIGNSGLVINNNNIFDYFGAAATSAGVAVNGGCNTFSITNNRFYQTATRTWTTGALHNAILMNSSTATSGVQGMTITGNIIGYSSNTQTGTYALTGSTGTFRAIQFSGIPAGTVSNINSNTIASISLTGVSSSGTSSSAPMMGIYVASGTTIANSNTIGSQSATGSITYSSSSASTSDVNAIFNFGIDNWVSNSNNIGGITASNTSTGAANVYGLRVNTSLSVSWTAQNNLVGGTVPNSIQSTTTATGTIVNGILNSSPIGTITGNTVRNLSTVGGTGTGASASISGIVAATSAVQTISQNTLCTFSATGASTVNGIITTSTGSNTITKNKIGDLQANNSGGRVVGLQLSASGATVTIANNLIGDLRAPASTVTSPGSAIIGINLTSTSTSSTMNVSFNTVYINAASSGTDFATTGLFHTISTTATTATLNLKNNIIVNSSTAAGTGLTVAYRRSGGAANNLANYGSASNNNDFYAGTPSATNLIYSDGTSTAQTIAAYKAGVFTAGTIAPRDSASISENPSFLSTTCTNANFLHINTTIPTQIESGGMPVAGITDDFDGDTRNASTPDIGADEFAGVLLDLAPPSITYTPLANTSSTSNRVFTATITDPSGVAGGSLVPRTYFRKNGGSYVWTHCMGSSPTYTCTIDNSNVGGVAATDLIEYFVVAQDTAGNVGANPSAGFSATSVEIVTSPPTNPNQYSIVGAVSGSFNVGTAQTYTSLTNAGGIFEFINNSEVTGNVTINITSDLTGELGTHGLNAFPAPHTITIKPSGAPRSITGSADNMALIRTNGASRVTIDGSVSGGTDRSLTIENTSVTVPQVVRFGSIGTTPVTNNTVKNCIIRNGVNTSSAVVITDVGGLAGYFNNITIQNNDIQRAFVGVFTNAVVAAGNGANLMITGNKLDSTGANAIRNVGLYVQGADGATVSNNSVGNFENVMAENDTGIWLATGTVNTTVSGNTVSTLGYTGTGAFAPYGIRDSGGATAASNNSIIGNTVSNISTNGTTAVYGIENSSGGTTIQKNNVSGIINTSVGTYGAFGINLAAGNNSVVRNNFVSNINHDMTGGAAFSTTFGVFGIRIAAGTGHQIYNNSVNLYGLQPGVPNSNLLTAAFAVVSTTSTGMDVRNNIFANNIIGGSTSVAHVSIYLPSGGTAAMNLMDNKNAYFYGTDAARAGTGQAGLTAGTNFFTTLPLLSAYTNTLGFATNDNMSQAYTTATVPSPFISNTDLHFGDIASPLIGAGDVIGSVTNDFDMDPRPASNPDIGADELVQSTASSFPTGIFYNGVLAGNDVLVGNATITNSLTLTGISNTGPNTLTLGCDAAVSGAGMLNYIIGDVAKQFCAPGSFSFPVGTPEDAMLSALPEYSPFNANVTAVGSVPSTLTVSVTDGVLPGSSPTQSASRYWDVTETGDITADISFTYLDQDVSGLENVYQVLRREMGLTNVYLGGTVNDLTNTASAPGVTEFSQWAAGNLAPTAANATVGGRVLTSNGRGISGARVVMIAPGGTPRLARTNPFGYYRFSDVPVGGQYVFSASDKRYQFVQPTITKSISGDDGGINFIALGGAGSGERPNRTYFDNAPMDFDGDGLTDISFFREGDNSWTIRRSSDNTYTSQEFGLKTDRLAPADFDGDGRTDLAVFRPDEGNWYIWQSASNSLRVEKFGSSEDIPVPSDFDGDGRADTALWRPGKNVLIVQLSSNGKTLELLAVEGKGLVPRVGDYDGDGRAELAIFIAETGVWQIRFQNGKMLELPLKGADGIPLFADFDGDGRADTGIYSVDTGIWTIRQSRSGEITQIQQGGGTDTPLIGDFDGDGRMDAGVFSNGIWMIRQSVTETVHTREFGLPNDLALPSVYIRKQ